MKITAVGIYIGKFLISYYGGMIALGVLVAALVGYYQIKRHKKSYNDFILLAAYLALGGVIGAKVLYLIVNIEKIDFNRLLDMQYLQQLMAGGFVYYGGVIGGLSCIFTAKRLFKIEVMEYIHICAPCLPIVHAFGRIGCSLVGCCYGREYHGVGSIIYHNSLYAPNDVSLFPVQLFEAVMELLIAAILLYYINMRSTNKVNALMYYVLLYTPLRFILEYLRYDVAQRGYFLMFSTSQWISIFLFVGGLTYIIAKKEILANAIN